MYTEIIKRMKKINLKYQIAAGVILVICGTLVLLSDYIKDKRDVVFSEMNLALSSMNMDDSLNNQDENIDNVEENLGIIDISKINLYKGFYNKDSNLNNVKFNLYVLPESNYPDIKGGNLIIAGHSGNYNNSYFANLYMLEVNDDIVIHYNNKKYVYKIDKIYNEKKTGRVRILRNKNNTTLTLITCTKDDNYHQTVYIAYLTSVE